MEVPLRKELAELAGESRLQGMATERQIGYLSSLLGQILGNGDSGTVARHQFLEHMFGSPSSKNLSKAEASVLIDWLTGGDRASEIYRALTDWGQEHGQGRLL